MKRTADILDEQRRSGRHPREQDPGGWVSGHSCWGCDAWQLDPPSRRIGDANMRMNWADFPPGLVQLFKELVWSLLVSRPETKPVALSQAGVLFHRCRYLARWMEANRRSDFGSLTPTWVLRYTSDLKAHLKEQAKERDEDYSTAGVAAYYRPLQFAFEQRRQLEEVGLKGLSFEPFGEGTPWAAAEEIMPAVEGFTPALPDEVVLPIVRRAHAMLHTPAEDIIALQSKMMGLRYSAKLTRRQGARRMHKVLSHARFSPVDGQPWRGPLNQLPEESEHNPDFIARAFKRLVLDLLAACVIVIRFQTGIRHGEILTFEPGLKPDGLPRCVTIEGSVSGAYELFFVNGVVEKGWDHPEETRWLLAGRIASAGNNPDAVRALQVLNRLLAPWREFSSDPDAKTEFLLQFSTGGFPDDPADVIPMQSSTLARLMKDFIEHQVDLSQLDATDPRLRKHVESKGRSVQSKQWRKTWANFVFRTNRKLLPSIAQQFQHFSTALTMEAYIGKDAIQMGLIESAATERAVGFMESAMDGDDTVGGMMKKVVMNGIPHLQDKVRGLSGSERTEVVRDWMVKRDIKVWPAPHGKCFIGLLPKGSRCHAAGASLDWSNQAPNFLTRSPRLCSGCECFGVEAEDVPFWAERYVSSRRIWEDAKTRYMEAHYVIAKERRDQSAAILRSLGVDVEQIWKENGHGDHDRA